MPDGNTPGKPQAKVRAQETETSRKRCLFPGESEGKEKSSWAKWTTSEDCAIVQFICLFWEDANTEKWPTIKDPQFWNNCAKAVMDVCQTTRTGKFNICIFLLIYVCRHYVADL